MPKATEARVDGGERGQFEAGLGEDARERIDVVGDDATPKKRGLDGSGAAPGERVEDEIARGGEARDEPRGQLGFEAGAIRNFVQRGCLALARSPKLARLDEVRARVRLWR